MTPKLLRRLHDDQRGQILPLFIFGVTGFVLLVAMVLNTGQSTVDRMAVQNGADAAAMTQAAWAARSLNVMAMNNVAQSQMFTVFMVTEALAWSMIEASFEALKQLKGAHNAADLYSTGCLVFKGICYAAMFGVAAVIPLAALANIGYIELEFRPITHGLPTSAKLMMAFSAMNEQVVNEFPGFSGQIIRNLSQKNGVDEFFFYPPCQQVPEQKGSCTGQRNQVGQETGIDLPVETGDAMSLLSIREMCRGADVGTTKQFHHREKYAVHGFPSGYGPYTFSGAGTDSERHARDYVNKKSKLYYSLVMLYWEGFVLEKLPGSRYTYKMGEQKSKDNNFTKRLNKHWEELVCGEVSKVDDLPSIDLSKARRIINLPMNINFSMPDFFPKLYRLRGALPGKATTYSTDDLQILVLARRSDRYRMFASSFPNPVRFLEGRNGQANPSTFAVSQALLYNTVSYDLYTQAWKARLVPTLLLNSEKSRKKVLDTLKNRASKNFSVVYDLYAKTQSDSLEQFNVH